MLGATSQVTTAPHIDEEFRERLRQLPPHRSSVVLDWPAMHTLPTQVESSVGPTIARPDLDEDVRERLRQIPPYRVVVLDCNCHSFDDVEVALCRVISGMTRAKAHQHAYEIHTTGASVVARAPKERAELYQEQLAVRGLRVTIEPD